MDLAEDRQRLQVARDQLARRSGEAEGGLVEGDRSRGGRGGRRGVRLRYLGARVELLGEAGPLVVGAKPADGARALLFDPLVVEGDEPIEDRFGRMTFRDALRDVLRV